MQFVLTTSGSAAISASPGQPPVLTAYRLGNGFNYTPTPADTDLRGTVVYQGTPSLPVEEGTQILKYTITIDPTAPDFAFGEIGLYLPGNVLFALAASSTLIQKTQATSSNNGTALKIDAFITTAANTEDFLTLGNSDNHLSMPEWATIDSLVAASMASPNVASVGDPSGSGSILALSRDNTWSFTGYSRHAATYAVASGTPYSMVVDISPGPLVGEGGFILVGATGPNAGSARVVKSVTGKTIEVNTPYNTPPAFGDTFHLLQRVSDLTQIGSYGGGATGGGTDRVFYLNDSRVTESFTLPAGKNALSAGPLTIDQGVTITIPVGQGWSIV